MSVDELDEIVDYLDDGEWVKSTIRDIDFLRSVYGEKETVMRRIEGSLDGGVTWKTLYNEEVKVLGLDIWNKIQWRVKEK